MIFQFLIALERCFEMQEGQSVYIERFGDVTITKHPLPLTFEKLLVQTPYMFPYSLF